jgi:hypothetical protein
VHGVERLQALLDEEGKRVPPYYAYRVESLKASEMDQVLLQGKGKGSYDVVGQAQGAD